jgi:hypothetical protein
MGAKPSAHCRSWRRKRIPPRDVRVLAAYSAYLIGACLKQRNTARVPNPGMRPVLPATLTEECRVSNLWYVHDAVQTLALAVAEGMWRRGCVTAQRQSPRPPGAETSVLARAGERLAVRLSVQTGDKLDDLVRLSMTVVCP